MQQVFCVISFVLFANVCHGQLDDIDVIQSEMSESMEKFAVGEALVLLSTEPNFPVVAERLVDVMNNRYGREWVTLIGTNLHTTIYGMKIVNGTMLLMEYKDKHVLLVQQQAQFIEPMNHTGVYEKIEQSKSKLSQPISTSDPAKAKIMVSLAQEVLHSGRDYEGCDDNTESKDIRNWCYRKVSEAMVDAINGNNFTSNGRYLATVGDKNRCFSETLGFNITEYHLFTLGDIYFEIRKLVD